MSAFAVSQPRFPALPRRYPFERTVAIAAVMLGGLAVVMLVDGTPRDAADRPVRELMIGAWFGRLLIGAPRRGRAHAHAEG